MNNNPGDPGTKYFAKTKYGLIYGLWSYVKITVMWSRSSSCLSHSSLNNNHMNRSVPELHHSFSDMDQSGVSQSQGLILGRTGPWKLGRLFPSILRKHNGQSSRVCLCSCVPIQGLPPLKDMVYTVHEGSTALTVKVGCGGWTEMRSLTHRGFPFCVTSCSRPYRRSCRTATGETGSLICEKEKDKQT